MGCLWGVIAKVSKSDIYSKWFINEISPWTRLESAFCDFSMGVRIKIEVNVTVPSVSTRRSVARVPDPDAAFRGC